MKFNCAYDELVDIHKLVENPKNPNKHPDNQIDRLAKIIDYQGQRSPVVVSNRSGFISKGHGRLLAMKKLGWSQVAVDYQDYESEAQEYADIVADNAIALWAELDVEGISDEIKSFDEFDAELLGFEEFNVPQVETLEPGCDEDEVPEEKSNPGTVLGDIWQLGRHRLMCGDATADYEVLLKNIKPKLCFTSPPYSDQRDYEGGKELAPEHLAKFMMADCGVYVVNLGLQRKHGAIYPYWNDYISVADSLDLKLLSWNIWDKFEAGSIGMQTAMFPIEHEWIFIFGKSVIEIKKTVECKHGGTKSAGNTRRQKDGSLTKFNDVIIGSMKKMGTVTRLAPMKARNHDVKHPAMFPVNFAESYIEACTNEMEIVYEPFGGSGSTLIACEKTGRTCYMMELEPKYVRVIIDRWEKYTGQKAELINGSKTKEES